MQHRHAHIHTYRLIYGLQSLGVGGSVIVSQSFFRGGTIKRRQGGRQQRNDPIHQAERSCKYGEVIWCSQSWKISQSRADLLSSENKVDYPLTVLLLKSYSERGPGAVQLQQ